LKKIFIISGEASGDLHGSNLIKNLLEQNPDLIIQGWGGDLMEANGMSVLKHIKELAIMGFKEVVLKLKTVLNNLELCKKQITDFQPDAIIFIDFPGFNLRIAEWAKKSGYKTIYYIAPQVWAWKENRVKLIKKYVDELIVILPFEVEYFKKHGINAFYTGHPLLDAVQQFEEGNPANIHKKEGICILPGSRKQEISRMLPIMLEGANQFGAESISIAGSGHIDKSFYNPLINQQNARLFSSQTYNLLSSSHSGIIKSGTSTLEAALFLLPEVVCYKGSNLSYQVAKRVIKIPYISLVNLILDKPLVKELIQNEVTPHNIFKELELLEDENHRAYMESEYLKLRDKLGNNGVSARIAEFILGSINN